MIEINLEMINSAVMIERNLGATIEEALGTIEGVASEVGMIEVDDSEEMTETAGLVVMTGVVDSAEMTEEDVSEMMIETALKETADLKREVTI